MSVGEQMYRPLTDDNVFNRLAAAVQTKIKNNIHPYLRIEESISVNVLFCT